MGTQDGELIDKNQDSETNVCVHVNHLGFCLIAGFDSVGLCGKGILQL